MGYIKSDQKKKVDALVISEKTYWFLPRKLKEIDKFFILGKWFFPVEVLVKCDIVF